MFVVTLVEYTVKRILQVVGASVKSIRDMYYTIRIEVTK